MGTLNREPQEYSRNMKDPGKGKFLYPYHVLRVPCLGFPFYSLILASGLRDSEIRVPAQYDGFSVLRVQGFGFKD